MIEKKDNIDRLAIYLVRLSNIGDPLNKQSSLPDISASVS